MLITPGDEAIDADVLPYNFIGRARTPLPGFYISKGVKNMKRNPNEVIDLLTIIKKSILEKLDDPMNTTLYHIRPDSLKWVIDETIEYIKESEDHDTN